MASTLTRILSSNKIATVLVVHDLPRLHEPDLAALQLAAHALLRLCLLRPGAVTTMTLLQRQNTTCAALLLVGTPARLMMVRPETGVLWTSLLAQSVFAWTAKVEVVKKSHGNDTTVIDEASSRLAIESTKASLVTLARRHHRQLLSHHLLQRRQRRSASQSGESQRAPRKERQRTRCGQRSPKIW
jgi:hypothetical protein